jgi:hypothetical protein
MRLRNQATGFKSALIHETVSGLVNPQRAEKRRDVNVVVRMKRLLFVPQFKRLILRECHQPCLALSLGPINSRSLNPSSKPLFATFPRASRGRSEDPASNAGKFGGV